MEEENSGVGRAGVRASDLGSPLLKPHVHQQNRFNKITIGHRKLNNWLCHWIQVNFNLCFYLC